MGRGFKYVMVNVAELFADSTLSLQLDVISISRWWPTLLGVMVFYSTLQSIKAKECYMLKLEMLTAISKYKKWNYETL